MKKTTIILLYAVILFSFAGAVLSGALLMQHFYPETDLGVLTCGSGMENPCIAISESQYSRFLGIPIASFGMLFYLFFMFSSMIANFARGGYVAATGLLLLPLSVAALLIDGVLAWIMVKIGLLCTLCLYTYVVNIILAGLCVALSRPATADAAPGLLRFFRESVLAASEGGSHKKAFGYSYILVIILLAVSVFSTTYALEIKTDKKRVTAADRAAFTKKFYAKPRRIYAFPDSPLTLGAADAPVTIHAYTDPLCSACYKFYTVEKYLFSLFKNKLRIIYYNYPLDSSCNPDMVSTLYPNSCTASRAMIAAAEAGVFEDHLVRHFSDYFKFNKRRYTDEVVINHLKPNFSGIDLKRLLASEPLNKILDTHINSARELGVNATPTLFVAGRKLVGVPPRELLAEVVRQELARQGQAD